jgi:hypothetical protein
MVLPTANAGWALRQITARAKRSQLRLVLSEAEGLVLSEVEGLVLSEVEGLLRSGIRVVLDLGAIMQSLLFFDRGAQNFPKETNRVQQPGYHDRCLHAV